MARVPSRSCSARCCRRALGEQPGARGVGAPVACGQRLVAQPQQRVGDVRVTDAAHHQRGRRRQLRLTAAVRDVGRGLGVLQAGPQLTGPVLGGGQFDEQPRLPRIVGPGTLRRGHRGGQIPGGILESERGGRRGRCRLRPMRRAAQLRNVGSSRKQMPGHLPAAVGGLPCLRHAGPPAPQALLSGLGALFSPHRASGRPGQAGGQV